jgi:hypothetical protein
MRKSTGMSPLGPRRHMMRLQCGEGALSEKVAVGRCSLLLLLVCSVASPSACAQGASEAIVLRSATYANFRHIFTHGAPDRAVDVRRRCAFRRRPRAKGANEANSRRSSSCIRRQAFATRTRAGRVDGEARPFDDKAFAACVRDSLGYTMGYDAAVRWRSTDAAIAFLKRHLTP